MTPRPATRYTIEQVLPHGPGMRLLDTVRSHDPNSIVCTLDVRPESPFFEAGGVPGWVGIEYMAQALCALIGIQRLQAGRPIQVELLLGTRAYECSLPAFPAGSRLEVAAELLFRDADGVCAFACAIRLDGREVAQAEIKAYGPDDIEPFLAGLEREAA